jgi:hypothetical protein
MSMVINKVLLYHWRRRSTSGASLSLHKRVVKCCGITLMWHEVQPLDDLLLTPCLMPVIACLS